MLATFSIKNSKFDVTLTRYTLNGCTHMTTELLLHPGNAAAEYFNLAVCVCVCLSVYLRAYLWNGWTDLHQIFYASPLAPWLGPPPAAWRYVMYFRFYGCRHVLS